MTAKFICEKCCKSFACKRNLKNHESKSLPCDLICKVCCIKYEDRFAYYRHLKDNACSYDNQNTTEVVEESLEADNTMILLPNMCEIKPVPLIPPAIALKPF